jgi:hypothetical protein
LRQSQDAQSQSQQGYDQAEPFQSPAIVRLGEKLARQKEKNQIGDNLQDRLTRRHMVGSETREQLHSGQDKKCQEGPIERGPANFEDAAMGATPCP